MSKFGVRTPLVSNKFNSLSKYPNSNVLAAGMLVADVLVLADDCTLYKCCIIFSLTSYEWIKKFTHTEAENTDTEK
jgi:hypothetical protein